MLLNDSLHCMRAQGIVSSLLHECFVAIVTFWSHDSEALKLSDKKMPDPCPLHTKLLKKVPVSASSCLHLLLTSMDARGRCGGRVYGL